jgi:hypothetical protein
LGENSPNLATLVSVNLCGQWQPLSFIGLSSDFCPSKIIKIIFLKHLFFSSGHNDNAYQVLTTALQYSKDLKNLTPWRDSNQGSPVLEADAMTPPGLKSTFNSPSICSKNMKNTFVHH